MATKPEEAEAAPPPPKNKKKLIIIIAVALLLVLGAGGAFLYINKQKAAAAAAAAAEEEGGEPVAGAHAPAAAAHGGTATPPVYLPMDNIVLNLADPGGEKVAQVGITLVVVDAKASDTVKAFMPTIRSGVLMLIAQKTSADLLSAEGKQKLIAEILRVTSIPFGGSAEEEEAAPATTKKKPKKKAATEYPVIGVLFSSLIVQ